MYVKVIKCSNKEFWYADKIGKVFEVKFDDDISNTHVVDNIDGTGRKMGGIFIDDSEEVENFTEDELFKPPVIEEPVDDIIALRAELELTQSAINELLMSGLGGV